MNALIGVERFFAWLLQTTWQAAVIALLILLAQFLLRERLSPGWRYGLWFLLVARLLMPMTPSSAVSVFNLAKWSKHPTAVRTPEPLPIASTDVWADQTIEPLKFDLSGPAVTPAARSMTTPEPAQSAVPRMIAGSTTRVSRQPAPIHWLAIASWVWGLGALVLTARFVWIEKRFRRRLELCQPVCDEMVLRLARQCEASLGVKQQVLIIETEDVETPAVYGFRRKRLLLPRGLMDRLPAEGRRHILLHELAHVKRRDPELNWALAVLQILHWFNPVLWFAFWRMRADRELATDDLALAHTPHHDRCSYGETILNVLEGLTQRRLLPATVGIGESKSQIKQRIRAIARSGGPRWRWAACTAAVVIAGIALTNAREDTKGIDLLKRYPTALTGGDSVPGHARPWQFTANDIFQVSHFKLELGENLRVEAETCDLGIGHCQDGAVWAVLLPRDNGKLTSPQSSKPETIVSVWLRFHPAEINRVFPVESVSTSGQTDLEDRIRQIVEAKFNSSWHAGNRAMIPEPKDMTVDVDTKEGPRRFFMVDKAEGKAEYVAAFADRSAEQPAKPADGFELDTNRASVVSVIPLNGATGVELQQDLRIQFDRPMNPYNCKLDWLAGGFQLRGNIQISPDHKEFVLPVQLAPGQHRLVLNRDQERERWIAFGRRPEMKPTGPSRSKEGFCDASGLAANEFRWTFSTRATPAKPEAGKPKVVSVSPASGATTPLLTTVEITFDQPMRPPAQLLPYLQTGRFSQSPSLIPNIESDDTGKRFIVPALLRSDDDVRLTIKGFYSADGVACDPVVLHYQTGTESLDPNYVQRAKNAAQDPKLQKLLASMKQARANLRSGIETVQTVRMGVVKNSFNSIEAQTAIFKWQAPKQVYGDISGPMSMPAFILGTDGQQCWLYSENDKGEKRLDQTPAAVTETDVLLVDPFSLGPRSVEEAISEADVVYVTSAKLEGRSCYRLERWEVRDDPGWATLTQWWIDEQTLLPTQIAQFYPAGCQLSRYSYASLNQSIPESAFQPPPAHIDEAQPLFFQDQPGAGERRFLRICDGSNGRMSGRLGWHGPQGTTSSGLN